MLGYIAIYYFLARKVARKLNKCNPTYFGFGRTDGDVSVGMETSVAIVKMVFDPELPGNKYGSIRLGLYTVRILLALAVPFVIVLGVL